MFGFFKKRNSRKIPRKSVLQTRQYGFQDHTFILEITDEELDVLRRVYSRSNIYFLIK